MTIEGETEATNTQEIKVEEQPKVEKAVKAPKVVVPKLTIRQVLEGAGKDLNWLADKLKSKANIMLPESTLAFYIDNDIKPEKKIFNAILKVLAVKKSEVSTKTIKILDVLEIQGRRQQWLLSRLHDKGHTKLDAPQLSRYANGTTVPRNPEIILDIAQILGVNSEIFF